MDPRRSLCPGRRKGRAKTHARPKRRQRAQARRRQYLRLECGGQRGWHREGDRTGHDQCPGAAPSAGQAMTRSHLLVDAHGRVLTDLRVSITDRCNFRCLYCLPETEAAENFYRGRWANMPESAPIARQWQPRSKILTFEEIERVVRVAVGLGIQKVRLTGGEPLLRRQIEKLVAKIAAIPGVRDLALTTNAFLFPDLGRALRDAGLRRVSFSLDSLDRDNFKKITGRDGLDAVLESVQLAKELELTPVKVNAVIIRGINDHE